MWPIATPFLSYVIENPKKSKITYRIHSIVSRPKDEKLNICKSMSQLKSSPLPKVTNTEYSVLPFHNVNKYATISPVLITEKVKRFQIFIIVFVFIRFPKVLPIKCYGISIRSTYVRIHVCGNIWVEWEAS